MKIALLTEKYTPDIGGLAISSERLARLLASAGYEVRVFSPLQLEGTGAAQAVLDQRVDTFLETSEPLGQAVGLWVEDHRWRISGACAVKARASWGNQPSGKSARCAKPAAARLAGAIGGGVPWPAAGLARADA